MEISAYNNNYVWARCNYNGQIYGKINFVTGYQGVNMCKGEAYTSGSWTNKDVSIELNNGTDNLSGHKETVYDITGPVNKSNQKNGMILNQEGTYTITVRTTDNAGNTAENNYTIKIDKTKPTVSLEVNTTSWTNQNVVLTGKARDTVSGIVAYGWTKTSTEPTGTTTTQEIGKWNNITKTTGEITKTLTTGSNNTAWYFWTKDEAGNTQYAIEQVSNIDLIKPEITLTATPTTWTNEKVILEATATDNESGIVAYAWTDQVLSAGNISWTKIGDTGISTTTQDKELTTEADNKTWYFWTKDQVGNTNNASIRISNIDKTDPTSGTMTMKLGSSTGANYTNDTWTKQNVYIALNSGSDDRSGIETTVYNINGPGINLTGQTASRTLTTEGTYKITVITADNAGNITVKDDYTVKIDKTAPTAGTLNMVAVSGGTVPINYQLEQAGTGMWRLTITAEGISSIQISQDNGGA